MMPESDQPTQHFRRISRSEFCAAYADKSVPVAAIAKRFGLSQRAVCRRARSYGVPVRGKDTKKPHVCDPALFTALWQAGVAAAEIAQFFGVHYRTVANTADRLGLEKRVNGARPKIGINEFLLREAMAASARETVGAMADAEMLDDPRRAMRRAA